VGTIETEFRTFPMELIAGKNDFNVTLRESGAKFQFNFAQVYWNSRLQMEHSRLIDRISKQSAAWPKGKPALVVADLMAGIGPFAVPLAMAGVRCHANDLNPASFKYLCINNQANRCERSLTCYNMCARDFVLQLAEKGVDFDHAIMNLPQSATDFLDAFIGLGTRKGWKKDEPLQEQGQKHRLPNVHVYAFSTADEPVADVAARSAAVLRCDVDLLRPGPNLPFIGHVVRDVAPKKVMICLSFELPLSVALAEPVVQYSARYPGRKGEEAGEGGVKRAVEGDAGQDAKRAKEGDT